MHGLMGKQNLYEQTVRVPFIICGPDIKAGEKNNELIYMQSIYATLCELARVEIPATVDFPSLMPIIKKQAKGEKYIFGAYKDVQRMVRSDKYKLIVYPKAKQIQLFDIVNDPHEKVNLYTVSEYAKVKRELFAAMKELQQKYHDPVVLDLPIK